MSPSHPCASVLIGTYNHADFLRRTLIGLARQSEPRFEVILCDDGSGPEIAELAEEWRERLPGGLQHIWQADQGFRKCRALNSGVLAARAEILIFLDADCIPHRHFVREHLRDSRPGSYLVGRRLELDARRTARLSAEGVAAGELDRLWFTGILSGLFGELRHFGRAIYLPRPLRRLWPRRSRGLLGCNFSCTKRDLVAINGFDEDFDSPGIGEDSDLEHRWNLCGIEGRSIVQGAICYHQYHPLAPRDEAAPAAYIARQPQLQSVCARGLRQRRAELETS